MYPLFQTAFYLPTDTNRLVHISNLTTTKDVSLLTFQLTVRNKIVISFCSALQLVQLLLKKFCVTDNPKKFSLYEEYGGDCKNAKTVDSVYTKRRGCM